jgi:hypothetical protein
MFFASNSIRIDEVSREGHSIFDENLDDRHHHRKAMNDIDGQLFFPTFCHDTEKLEKQM